MGVVTPNICSHGGRLQSPTGCARGTNGPLAACRSPGDRVPWSLVVRAPTGKSRTNIKYDGRRLDAKAETQGENHATQDL
jgi:hypothetical protein